MLESSAYLLFAILFFVFCIFPKKKTKKRKCKRKSFNKTRSNKTRSNKTKDTVAIGNILEEALAKELGKHDEIKIYRNILVPIKGCGFTTEIDIMLVSKKGIAVFECKNYSGTIYGKEDDEQWYAQYTNRKTKFKLYNPIMQNKGHIKHLMNYLGIRGIPVYSFVLFGRNADISNLKGMGNLFKVDHNFNKNITYIVNTMIGDLSSDKLLRIINKMNKLLDVTEEQRLNHIKQVNYYKKHH